MKLIFLYPTIIMLFTTSLSYSQTNDYAEPLIKVYGKIMNRQHIEFLEKEGDKFKITYYGYYINIKKNIVRISGGESYYYNLNSEYINVKHYHTSEDFRKGQSRWNVKYYQAIDPDFLIMNNKKKMQVLNSLVFLKEK
jgi:hypothetical protein